MVQDKQTMNKILIILIVISCSLSMNAQRKKDREKEDLEAKLQTLKSKNAKIEKRKFETESPELSLRKRLAFYNNIEELVEINIFRRNPAYKNLPIAKSYISLIKMYGSLKNGGYKQEENEAFKRELDTIKIHVLSMKPKHQDSFIKSFNDLDNCIRNYRFAMFELARVFVLVKEKEKERIKTADIYKSLQEDYETDIIDMIPYTRYQLDKYIRGNNIERGEMIRDLKESCDEAFKNFKEE